MNESKREIIVYLIVGVMTTLVSWLACFVATFFLDSSSELQNFLINTFGWIIGVLFAYPLNRKWVFKSKNKKIISEFIQFVMSRISTWFLDVIIMWFFVNVFPFTPMIKRLTDLLSLQIDGNKMADYNYWFVKVCISSVLVTILNYVFSRVFIFRKKLLTVE